MTRAPSVAIFGVDTIDRLCWPADLEAQYAKKYLVPFIKNGPLSYVDNAHVRMLALTADDLVLPLVISDETPGDSDVCSLYSHYVRYTLEEMAKRNDRLSRWLLKPLTSAAAVFLRAAHIDKVVYVNNWLLTTNPCPNLTSSQVREITAHLEERYPGYAIVFRSVNKHVHRRFFDVLRENKYKMVASRKVYMLDRFTKGYKQNENVKRHRNLQKQNAYEVMESHELDEKDIIRITKLYRDLYLKKHSLLNPQFNERFFSLVLQANTFVFKALRKNGQVDSFFSCYSRDGVMTGALLGYDIDLPQNVGLYRQAIAIAMTEARNREEILNLSGGSGPFKVFRGCQPCIEYEAIYDRHLRYHRRLAYFCIWAGGVFQSIN